MSWKYPPNRLKDTYVIDNVAVNENFLGVVEETSGYLNEHNFTADPLNLIVSREATLADGYSMKLAYSRADVNSHYTETGTLTKEGVPPNWVKISSSPSFQTFSDDGLTLTFTSRGGSTWLCASFTLHNGAFKGLNSTADQINTAALGESPIISPRKGFGFNCALQIDGVTLASSLVGTGDLSNENLDGRKNKNSGKIYPQGGGGVQGAATALVLDTVIDLEPGTHTVRVAVENIMGSNTNGTDVPCISSRELFALELTR
jgi:hypothetical protein